MAQNINSYKTNGLFKADSIEFSALLAAGTQQVFEADLSDCKDSIIALVNIPAGGTGNHSFVIQSCEGGKEITVPLVAEKINVVRFTTKGVKNANGIGKFKFITDNTAGVSGIGVSVCFIKHADVVNH